MTSHSFFVPEPKHPYAETAAQNTPADNVVVLFPEQGKALTRVASQPVPPVTQMDLGRGRLVAAAR